MILRISRSICHSNLLTINWAEFLSVFGVDQAIELVEVLVILLLLLLKKSLLLPFMVGGLLGHESKLHFLIFLGVSISNLDSVQLDEAVNSLLNDGTIKFEEFTALVYESIELVIVLHPVRFLSLLLFCFSFSGLSLHEVLHVLIIDGVEFILANLSWVRRELDGLSAH